MGVMKITQFSKLGYEAKRKRILEWREECKHERQIWDGLGISKGKYIGILHELDLPELSKKQLKDLADLKNQLETNSIEQEFDTKGANIISAEITIIPRDEFEKLSEKEQAETLSHYRESIGKGADAQIIKEWSIPVGTYYYKLHKLGIQVKKYNSKSTAESNTKVETTKIAVSVSQNNKIDLPANLMKIRNNAVEFMNSGGYSRADIVKLICEDLKRTEATVYRNFQMIAKADREFGKLFGYDENGVAIGKGNAGRRKTTTVVETTPITKPVVHQKITKTSFKHQPAIKNETPVEQTVYVQQQSQQPTSFVQQTQYIPQQQYVQQTQSVQQPVYQQPPVVADISYPNSNELYDPIYDETPALEGITDRQIKDYQDIVKIFAERWHQPSTEELEAIQEQMLILQQRGQDPVMWLTTLIKEVAKKSPEKRYIGYLIGLIRNRLKHGWGVGRFEEEDLIIKEVENKVGQELSLEERQIIYKLMGQYGQIRLILQLNKVNIVKMFLDMLESSLRDTATTPVKNNNNPFGGGNRNDYYSSY